MGVGARQFTQVMDVSFTIQLAVEKGNDDRGQWAVGAEDIWKFYDSLAPM